jgi:hypothetical protein
MFCKTRLFILISLAIFTLSALFLPSCASTQTPSKVMEEYVTALQKEKYDKAWGLLSLKTQEHIAGPSDKNGSSLFKDRIKDALKQKGYKTQLATTKVTGEKIEDQRATVTIQYNYEENSTTSREQVIPLVREKGTWKIRF